MTEHTVNREDKIAETESPGPSPAPSTANSSTSLSSALARHVHLEKASFHTPGHKGRQAMLFSGLAEEGETAAALSAANDLTELPGLDDLANPTGVLADLEKRAAALWQSGEALISIGGASAALTAAILATAGNGTHIVVPRHAHRSVINALCLARLKPIWYEPVFDSDWGIWGETRPETIAETINATQKVLSGSGDKIAAVVVVSPTYAGAVSDIKAISAVSRRHGIALIVDEAHGAHLVSEGEENFAPTSSLSSAITSGADAVAHSWHKTLPALTQTGMLHIAKDSLVSAADARSCLNMISTSSPSYLLLDSMVKTINLLEGGGSAAVMATFERLGKHFKNLLAGPAALPTGLYQFYEAGCGNNPSHLLVKSNLQDADKLNAFLQERGIYAEAIMGAGLLFMLGMGSTTSDVQLACDAILACPASIGGNSSTYQTLKTAPPFEPLLAPHQAMLMKRECLPKAQTLGRIAAQCLAPCPPGIPILIPGQKITEEVLALVSDKTVMVVAD